MSDPPTLRPEENESNAGGRDSSARTPRWVKAFAVAALVLAVLFVVLLLAGRGHGPGRHAGGTGAHAPPPGAHVQP